MNFYQAMQMNESQLLHHMHQPQKAHSRSFYFNALIIKNLLLVLWAIIFIGGLAHFFGSENTALAVVTFCMLLSTRFVSFGYQLHQSLIGLSIVFIVLLLGPIVTVKTNFEISLLVHFISLSSLYFITSHNPEMGNPGLYSFGYIFITGNQPTTIESFWQRVALSIVCFLIIASVYTLKHYHKHRRVALFAQIKGTNFWSYRNLWFMQIALGISLLLTIGQYTNIARFMWVGFAFSSLITNYQCINLNERFLNRLLGVIIGSGLFAIIYLIIPHNSLFLLGPIAGFCLGLYPGYRYKTIFNCFGGLLLASSIFGMTNSVGIRIFDNFLGLTLGYLYLIISRKLYWFYQITRKKFSK